VLYCLYEKGTGPTPPPSKHHSWEAPIPADPKKKGSVPSCKESDTEYVAFDTKENKKIKAVTCAPKAQDNKCPATDIPMGYTGTPIAVQDANGKTTCELPCSADSDCGKVMKCIDVKVPNKKLFGMQSGGDRTYYLCLHKALLISQQFVLFTLILSFLVM